MHPDLLVTRRLYRRSYVDYLQADRAWQLALSEAAQFVPEVRTRLSWRIGAPGSRLRRIYEAREHALDRLAVARTKYHNAEERLKRRQDSQSVVYAIGYVRQLH